jgi:hypothetical protein
VNWRRKLIGANLELYLALLEDHNNMVHGASKIENAQKVYQQLQAQVEQIYKIKPLLLN